MAQANDQFRDLLESGDFRQLRRVASRLMPHLPPPASDAEAEQVMHIARTGSVMVSFDRRAWSHRWLTERGLPSALPDDLKPKAERLCPIVHEGVGFAYAPTSALLRPAADEIAGDVHAAIRDCYANGDTDPAVVRGRMLEVKEASKRRLFGKIGKAN